MDNPPDEEVRKEQLATREKIEMVQVRAKERLDVMYAERSGCPEVAERERETCRGAIQSTF